MRSKQATMASIKIPAPLRAYTSNQKSVDVSGATVEAAMRDLVAQHPDLKPHLYNEQDELRAFVNLFLRGEDVRHMQGLDTPLAGDDELRIVPSVAGGWH